ncbi:hypothetical protein ACH4Q7_27530 [Streptomyces roseolus]|uniref:hypothetical protein n=1 Tax=Streptomyces roseolus TaxID=67358 RepID=UPI0037A236E6
MSYRMVLPPLCAPPPPQHTNQLVDVSIQPITGHAAMKLPQPYGGTLRTARVVVPACGDEAWTAPAPNSTDRRRRASPPLVSRTCFGPVVEKETVGRPGGTEESSQGVA